MDHFEYVMVLVSIIIGLAIAHQLLGVAGIVDRLASRRQPLRLSVAHLSWLGAVFCWTVLFWWWEFRFSEVVVEWTVGLYFFLILYAVALFLLGAILVPRTWDPVDDLGQYFVERRLWFYPLLFGANALDVIDTWFKGGVPEVLDAAPMTWLIWGTIAVAGVVGVRSRSTRTHDVLGALVLALQILSGFSALPTLA